MDDFLLLGLNVSTPEMLVLIYPGTGDPLADMDGKKAYLELLSEDSEAGREFDRQRSRETLQRARKGGGVSSVMNEDPFSESLDRILALLTGWYLVAPDKNPIDMPFTKENARKVLSHPSTQWMLKQAVAFVRDGRNFILRSSPN